jgi:dCTP deaminase
MHQKRPTVLSDRELAASINGRAPFITTTLPAFPASQIQPSSLDLTIGHTAYGMGVAALPRPGMSIEELVASTESHYKFTLDDGKPGFLHKGYTYIFRLNESLSLPEHFSAKFSPKSSTGRTDMFVRILADGVPRFDSVPEGYRGNLYLEVTPLSFHMRIRPGLALVQMRIRNGDARLTESEIALLQAEKGMFFSKEGNIIPAHDLKMAEHGVYMHIDLDRDIVGFVARTDLRGVLNLFEVDVYDPLDFWEPIPRPRNGRLVIDPGRFYLLATKERVKIPETVCGDIAPYDTSAGEFRTHYAGFFDPGFGGEDGTTGVLEVRGREMPHALSDGDPICLMNFEAVSEVQSVYKGNYQGTGPSISKHFKRRYEAWLNK